MKNEWWIKQAREIEDHAKHHNSKKMFQGIKLPYSKRSTGLDPVNSSEGVRLWERIFFKDGKNTRRKASSSAATTEALPSLPLLVNLQQKSY